MRSFLFLALLGFAACQPVDNKSDGSDGSGGSSQSLLEDLNSLATGSCSRTSDCLTAGMGARACGGPEDYIVFSKWDSAQQISEVLYSYNEARKKEISGTIGTCEFRAPPAVACVQNKCKKQSSGSGDDKSVTLVAGTLTLKSSNVADAPAFIFKSEGDPTSYYIRNAQLDFSAKSQVEGYRSSSKDVKLKVRIFGIRVEAPACEFMFASCSTKVVAFDLRSIKLISVVQ